MRLVVKIKLEAMKYSSLEEDLAARMKRSLIFLRNPVSAYYNGFDEETISNNVVIRVLFYDTKSSLSLVKKMDYVR